MHAPPHKNSTHSKCDKMVNEADIKLALDDLKSQKKPNYAATAKKYHLNQTTLMRRYKGHTMSNPEARSIYQKWLTSAQEDVLV